MDPIIARKTWRTVELYHGFMYFAPEPAEAYKALGLTDGQTYFGPRSAPMGAVPADVAIATFYNFNPEFVRSAIPSAWDIASPAAMLEARLDAVDRALTRLLPDAVGSDHMVEAAALARHAAEAATNHLEGRPLFAGCAAQPWPDQPHMVLWQAQTLLREFRGDGHISLLVANQLSGLEALVLHAATGVVGRPSLQGMRAWSDHDWDAAVSQLGERGLLDETGAFTETGKAFRAEIEDHTDLLALAPYQALGDDGCARLRELVRPWSKTIGATISF